MTSTVDKYFDAGYRAFDHKLNCADCPYNLPSNRDAWIKGWKSAHQDYLEFEQIMADYLTTEAQESPLTCDDLS